MLSVIKHTALGLGRPITGALCDMLMPPCAPTAAPPLTPPPTTPPPLALLLLLLLVALWPLMLVELLTIVLPLLAMDTVMG